MDKYSDPRIPFNVGVWCRSHKFNPLAVSLSRGLQSIATRKAELEAAEIALEVAEQELKDTIALAEQELENSKNGY